MPFNAATGYGGIGEEATAGTGVAPEFFYPFTEIDFDFQDEIIEWQEIRGSRQAKQAQDGPIRPSATMSGAVYPEGAMALLLKGVFGSVKSTPAGGSTQAYNHTFGDAATLPSLSIERSTGYGDSAGSVFAERLAGCKVESLSFTMSFGEQVSFSSTLQATKAPNTAITPVNRSAVTYPNVEPLYFRGASVEVNGQPNARFKTLNIEFNNTLERQETLNGERGAYAIFEGAFEASLSGTMVFEDTTYYDYLLNSEEITAEVFCGNGHDADASVPFGLRFAYPRLRVIRHSIPFSAGSTIEADVEFSVLFDQTEHKMVEVVMTNKNAGLNY